MARFASRFRNKLYRGYGTKRKRRRVGRRRSAKRRRTRFRRRRGSRRYKRRFRRGKRRYGRRRHRSHQKVAGLLFPYKAQGEFSAKKIARLYRKYYTQMFTEYIQKCDSNSPEALYNMGVFVSRQPTSKHFDVLTRLCFGVTTKDFGWASLKPSDQQQIRMFHKVLIQTLMNYKIAQADPVTRVNVGFVKAVHKNAKREGRIRAIQAATEMVLSNYSYLNSTSPTEQTKPATPSANVLSRTMATPPHGLASAHSLFGFSAGRDSATQT